MLYHPLNTLKRVALNIWIVDGDLIKMDYVIKVPFSTRMTIVKLADGKLWIHSPIQLTEALCKQIDALGEVAYLISPNFIHYAYIPQWQKRYPQAKAYASPGVKKRAKSKNINIHFDEDLQDEAPLAWAEEIDQLIFKGSTIIQEVVFFHRSSKTLILTDLIENFEPAKVDSKPWRLIHKVGKIADPDGQTPVDMRMTFSNRKTARSCLNQMLAWHPEKVILAHGRWYEENGTAELKRAFRWLRK